MWGDFLWARLLVPFSEDQAGAQPPPAGRSSLPGPPSAGPWGSARPQLALSSHQGTHGWGRRWPCPPSHPPWGQVPKVEPRWVGWGLPLGTQSPSVCAVCGPLLCRPWEAAEPAPGGILEAAFCIAAALLLGGGRLCSSSQSGRRQHSTELGVSSVLTPFRSLSGAQGLVPRALHVSPWGRRCLVPLWVPAAA